MKNIYRLVATIATATVLSGMYSIPAWAVDEKTIPATGCTVLSGAGSALRDVNGRLFNTSTIGELNVLCPLVRDNVVAAPTSVKVVVIDNSSTIVGSGNIACQVRAMTPAGGSSSSGAVKSTSGTNSAGTILTLTPVLEADRGAYTVHCTIPRRGLGDPSSAIASITIDEP